MEDASSEAVPIISEHVGDRLRQRYHNHGCRPYGAITTWLSDWNDFIQTPPPQGAIRILVHPRTALTPAMRDLWFYDMTLTEWHERLQRLEDDDATVEDSAEEDDNVVWVADEIAAMRALFEVTQRQRWLARKVINRWRYRMWAKSPQCNVDLIELAPVADRDAIYLTDTTNRHVYRFHRRDVFNALIAKLTYAEEMLPNPRTPTNPYTNATLTLAQTIAICQQLVTDYARRGRCPPVLFSGFCNANYNIKRFYEENSSLLAQHAIRTYFKEVTPHNLDTVYDTANDLLTHIQADYTSVALRRWFRQTPLTPLHHEWLALIRDYTLYMNLHVQARRHWYSDIHVYADVADLWGRTTLPDPTSTRIRTLRTTMGATNAQNIIAELMRSRTIVSPLNIGLPSFLQPPALPVAMETDISGSTMTLDLAIQLLHNSLFRL